MTGLHYYGRDGTRITFESWSRLLASEDAKRVALDEVGPYLVSTVWLGLDHGFGYGGPPLIFETMVFPSGSYDELDCRRYATEEQALAGHAETVTLLRATTLDLEDLGETSADEDTPGRP